MIFITGDVHSKKFSNWEQEGFGPNVKTALEYLKILKKYNLSATLFINGICLDKEKEEVEKLLNYDVELGGHTYDNFGDKGNFFMKIKYYFLRMRFGCNYGSYNSQKKDIEKIKKAFEKLGLKMTSWRTHSYSSNEDPRWKLLNS